jgi:ribonuclease Z
MKVTSTKAMVSGLIVAALAAGYVAGRSTEVAEGEVSLIGTAHAIEAQAVFSPVKALPELDVYYPGTEDLAPDEMRVIACGTGMPNARPKQAAACFLVELGNGEKFIFDIGTGSA